MIAARQNAEILELKEYVRVRISPDLLSEEEAKYLWQNFGTKISISPPSFQTEGQWELTSIGYVGYLPVSDTLHLSLLPKIPLRNLFGMWEYAYHVKIEFLEEEYPVTSLQDFYEQLARNLATLILQRSSRGYYRDYQARSGDLANLRGRVDLLYMIQHPWQPKPRCHFFEHTVDLDDNQILAWTMFCIIRSGLCSDRSIPLIHKSYRSLGHLVTLRSFQPEDLIHRIYNRLNEDYSPMHALCRFFLESLGPEYSVGDHQMTPFLVNMAELFEKFVAEWLRKNLPEEYELGKQERFYIDVKGEVSFKVDLIIYETATKRPKCVLDTKYKAVEGPSSDDIAQVAFYALAKDCQEAILVYPAPLEHPLNTTVNGINIRTIDFSLAGDLEIAGQKFLTALLSSN